MAFQISTNQECYKQPFPTKVLSFEYYKFQKINEVYYNLLSNFNKLLVKTQKPKIFQNHGSVLIYTGQIQLQTITPLPQLPQ